MDRPIYRQVSLQPITSKPNVQVPKQLNTVQTPFHSILIKLFP